MFPNEEAILGHVDDTLSSRKASTTLRKFSCLNFTPRWPRWAGARSLSNGGYIPEG